jgi:uncharacterized membrane protein YfcA
MIILGYLLAALIGSTLGLIGAGGSILTVPILVYFFKISPLLATTYSLLIVGITALIGAASYYKKNLANVRLAVTFAIPAMLSALITRTFIMPNLPDKIFTAPKEIFIMLLFALLMLGAALFMLKPINKKTEQLHHQNKSNFIFLKLLFGSSAIGFLTAMVGAGGGFLIIPTLIMLFGLNAKESIGTSLIIITINSLVGFGGDLFLGIKIDWIFLSGLIALMSLGMTFGLWVSKYFDASKLKKIFHYLF